MMVNTSNICFAVRGAPPPVLPAKGDLGRLLPCAEAVVNGATRKALLPDALVDSATEIRSQMEAWLFGVFVNREVGRG
jgi:hypothetical protein